MTVKQPEQQAVADALELEAIFAAPNRMQLGEFLNLVLKELSSQDAVLAGGLAISVHAKPRATEDLDFVVAAADLDKLADHFKKLGFVLKEELPYVKPNRVIYKMEYRGREVDFIGYKDATFTASMLKRAKSTSLLGQSVKIVSAEDLILTKLGSMRYKDKADIMAIRHKLGDDKLDLGYIRTMLWELGITDRIEFMKLPVED